MESNPLLYWSLVVIVAVLTLQNIFLAVLMLIGTTRLCRLFLRSREKVAQLCSFLDTVDKTVTKTSRLLASCSEWGKKVEEATEGVALSITKADEKVEQALSYVQTSVSHFQKEGDRWLSKFSKTSEEFCNAVLEPASQISLHIRSLGGFLGKWFMDDETDKDPSQYKQDQEIFI